MTHRTGRHFLQVPGPSNVPDRVLRAIAAPTIDHRGPAFARLALDVIEGLKAVFKTKGAIMIYPASGTGAWEAALTNLLSPGDRILMFETGHFATLWQQMAKRLSLEVDFVAGDWRRGVPPALLDAKLGDDRGHAIKAVCCVHNETSTGVASNIAAVRRVMDARGHPALLLVDTISSLASMDYRHDEWAVDVTVAGSQKGLMLPPGLGFNAVSEKALAASKHAGLPRSYWRWDEMLESNRSGFFAYTPATNLLFGLREALAMLLEEGLDSVFARHALYAGATRAAVRAWGLDIQSIDPAEHSSALTAVVMPDGHDADTFRRIVLERFDMSLGAGLGRLKGRIFRIGHLGSFNELMLAGTLAGVEMGFTAAGIPHKAGGVQAALIVLGQPIGNGNAKKPAGPGRTARTPGPQTRSLETVPATNHEKE
jgi:alanine-glyoxylate transaminase/serine-glyoxylate transaminase/serine-pyruvate transaminase